MCSIKRTYNLTLPCNLSKLLLINFFWSDLSINQLIVSVIFDLTVKKTFHQFESEHNPRFPSVTSLYFSLPGVSLAETKQGAFLVYSARAVPAGWNLLVVQMEVGMLGHMLTFG